MASNSYGLSSWLCFPLAILQRHWVPLRDEPLSEKDNLLQEELTVFELDTESRKEILVGPSRRERRLSRCVVFAIGLAVIVIGIETAVLAASLMSQSIFSKHAAAPCASRPTRREWRALSNHEKIGFTTAVRCLSELPSILDSEGSIYDDLVWVHVQNGLASHSAASFLPWHRMFLHVFEGLLVEKCGLKTQLPYWDWALDWQNLSQSTIWDSKTGFGGDGSPTGDVVVDGGRCVVDGPFANLTLLYHDLQKSPHCLSRGFQYLPTGEMGRLAGQFISPEVMGQIATAPHYPRLRLALEESVHNAIHYEIKGDLSTISAANDPIFFLHHAQIDRIWWLWQNDDVDSRLCEYSGNAFTNISDSASLSDLMKYSGLSKSVKVAEVMRTDSALLCYKY